MYKTPEDARRPPLTGGGKSGHRRAGRSLTATGGDPRERATENETAGGERIPAGKGEMAG